MSQTETNPITDAMENGWEIIGVVNEHTGGTLLNHDASVILANEQGKLKRVKVDVARIPEWDTSDE